MDETSPFKPIIFFKFLLFLSSLQKKSSPQKKILHRDGGEALAQVAQRSCGCPLLGSVQGQAGRGFEHPALVEGVPACCRGVGQDDL